MTICAWKASSSVLTDGVDVGDVVASASSQVWCMPRLVLAMRSMSKAPITGPCRGADQVEAVARPRG